MAGETSEASCQDDLFCCFVLEFGRDYVHSSRRQLVNLRTLYFHVANSAH